MRAPAIPALNNRASGSSQGFFFQSEPLVGNGSATAIQPINKWVAASYCQLEGARSRSHRVHVRSLGAILALRERIAGCI